MLAVAAAAGGDPASPPDPSGMAQDTAILERIAGLLGDQPSVAELAAGLRALAEVGDPHQDIRAGLLSEAQAESIAGLYGRAAAGRVIERALALEAQLRKLASLGTSPVRLPPRRLRVVAVDAAAGLAEAQTLGGYLAGALTYLLRGQPGPGPAWQHTVLVSGAETLRGDVLDRLAGRVRGQRHRAGAGLPVAAAACPGAARPGERGGRVHAAGQRGRRPGGQRADRHRAPVRGGPAHRHGGQLGQRYRGPGVHQHGRHRARSAALSRSAGQSSGQSGGRGRSWAGSSPFAPRTASAHGETSYSATASDSVSLTEGINRGTSWGQQTALAVGANRALAQASQRSREFLVEQHELQQLPPSAVIVSYASPAGRRVVLADANPGILGLPTATLHTLDEVMRSAAPRPGALDPPATWPPPPAGRPAEPRPPAEPQSASAGWSDAPEPQPDLAPLPDPLPRRRDEPDL